MRTYRKTDIHSIEMELTSHHAIIDRDEKQVIALKNGKDKIFVSLDSENELYDVIDDKVWSAPVIIINNGNLTISYTTDLEVTVAYTKAVEQLNNPNIEYITF